MRWNIESLLRWVWRQWGRPLIPEWITGSFSTLWSSRACAAVVQGQGEFVWRNKPKSYGSERGNITGYVPDSDSCKLLVSQKGLNLTFFSHAENAPKKVSFKNPAYFQHEKRKKKRSEIMHFATAPMHWTLYPQIPNALDPPFPLDPCVHPPD